MNESRQISAATPPRDLGQVVSSVQWKWSLPLQVRCHTGDQAPRLGQGSWDTADAPYVLMPFTEKMEALARPVVFLSFRTQAKDS